MDLNVLGIIAALVTMLVTMLGVGVTLARMIRDTTAALDGKIDTVASRLDGKIEKLDGRIEKLDAKLDAKIDAVHRELVETRVALTDRAARLEGVLLGLTAPEAANLRAAAESA